VILYSSGFIGCNAMATDGCNDSRLSMCSKQGKCKDKEDLQSLAEHKSVTGECAYERGETDLLLWVREINVNCVCHEHNIVRNVESFRLSPHCIIPKTSNVKVTNKFCFCCVRRRRRRVHWNKINNIKIFSLPGPSDENETFAKRK
jgi:hypothetical protein